MNPPAHSAQVTADYDAWHRHMGANADAESPLSLSWYRSVWEEVRLYTSGKVLEIGCGRGVFAMWLEQHAPQFQITALDFSGAAIDIAQQRAAAAGSSVQFVQGDAQNLPFASETFDLVVSCECMEHVPQPAAMAQEMHRVLRPGGAYALTTPSQLNGMMMAWAHSKLTGRAYNSGAGVQPHENFYFFWNVCAHLRNAGLSVDRMESSTYQWLLLPRVAPARLCTQQFTHPFAKTLAFPFGLHFSFFGRKPVTPA